MNDHPQPDATAAAELDQRYAFTKDMLTGECLNHARRHLAATGDGLSAWLLIGDDIRTALNEDPDAASGVDNLIDLLAAAMTRLAGIDGPSKAEAAPC